VSSSAGGGVVGRAVNAKAVLLLTFSFAKDFLADDSPLEAPWPQPRRTSCDAQAKIHPTRVVHDASSDSARSG
jgi:hypothetical protein